MIRTMGIKLRIVIWAITCQLILHGKVNSNIFNLTLGLPYVKDLCQLEGSYSGPAINRGKDKDNCASNLCCKGCFCVDGCDDKQVIYEYYGMTKCIDTMEIEGVTTEYRFVINEPTNGCVNTEAKTTGLTPSCDQDIIAAPWGNFYPVYSFDKMVNFKNFQCALCHGATNTVKWNVYTFFWGKDSLRLKAFRDYYKHFNSTDIKKAFYPPNKESRGFEHICHTVFDKCNRDTFYIPTWINMTQTHIIQACEEGPTSFYVGSSIRVFKNVFCAVCNGFTISTTDTVRCYIEDDSDDDIRGSVKSFASLLDPDYIEFRRKESEEWRSTLSPKLACLSNDENDTLIGEPSCREVLCPALMDRKIDGTCDYPVNKMYISKLFVTLNLTAHIGVIADNLVNLSKTDLQTIFNESMPWPRNCDVVDAKLRIDITGNNSSELFVSLGLKTFDFIDLKNLKRTLGEVLDKKWPMGLGRSLIFQQEFHRHGMFRRISEPGKYSEYYQPYWAYKTNNNPLFLNLSSPKWIPLFSNALPFSDSTGNTMDISMMYFCEQVALQADEFVFSHQEVPLYLVRQRKYLYPSEFYVYKDENGRNMVNICVEDSDFEVVSDKNMGLFYGISTRLTLIVLMLHLCIFTNFERAYNRVIK